VPRAAALNRPQVATWSTVVRDVALLFAHRQMLSRHPSTGKVLYDGKMPQPRLQTTGRLSHGTPTQPTRDGHVLQRDDRRRML
jgi:hypothetical protein